MYASIQGLKHVHTAVIHHDAASGDDNVVNIWKEHEIAAPVFLKETPSLYQLPWKHPWIMSENLG